MQPILSDIRALSGVTGVAVIAKRSGKVEHLFPAAFTDRHTRYLRELITSTYQRLHGFTRLALRFERVVVHLYNQPEYLLFVTTLPDTDTRQFEMVVNSKFAAIGRLVAHPADGPRSGGSHPVHPRGPSSPSASMANPVIAHILGACNSLTDQLADSHGRLRLANDWRKARQTTRGTDGVLDPLLVDAAGRMQWRKGQPSDSNSTTIAALAAMIECFLDALGAQRALAEEELHLLLKPHVDLLEPTGFFIYFGQSHRMKSAR